MCWPSSFASLPWGGLIALAVIVAIEAAVYVLVPSAAYPRFCPVTRKPTTSESVMQWQVMNNLDADGSCDILINGDSSGLVGLIPKEIRCQTGLTTRNVSTISLIGIEGHLGILKLLTAQQGPPKLMVYHMAEGLLSPTAEDVEAIGHYARARPWLDTLARGWSWPPSRAFRDEVAGWLMSEERLEANLASKRGGTWPSDDEVHVILSEQKGFLGDEYSRMDWRKYRRLETELSEHGERMLREMFSFAKAHDVRVLLMFNPSPETVRIPENEEGWRELEARLSRLAADFANVKILRPLARFYPDDWCATKTHLKPEGARRETETLVRWIRDHRDGFLAALFEDKIRRGGVASVR